VLVPLTAMAVWLGVLPAVMVFWMTGPTVAAMFRLF
jgi:hypothetical protein